jgi:hypothetical protein
MCLCRFRRDSLLIDLGRNDVDWCNALLAISEVGINGADGMAGANHGRPAGAFESGA